MLDRFDCYEYCVQSPRHITALLRAVHGGRPISLREDFCGTAALSRRWCTEARRAGEDARALALDLDEACLAKGREMASAGGVRETMRFLQADSVSAPDQEAADVIFVGNFSVGYIHDRSRTSTHACNPGKVPRYICWVSGVTR